MARRQEYRTIKATKFQDITLPERSFIQPIDQRWMPDFWKDTVAFRFLRPEKETFAYTSHGIMVIMWDDIEVIK